MMTAGPAGGGIDKKPLAGKSVIVTRSRSQASEFSEMLRATGAIPMEIPVIDIGPPEDASRTIAAIVPRLEQFDWTVFTSRNGFAYFRRLLLDHLGIEEDAVLLERLAGCRMAAVGASTASAMEEAGWRVDLVPASFSAEALLSEIEGLLADRSWRGTRFLFPRGDLAGGVLPRALKAKGMEVTELTVYINRPNLEAVREAIPLLAGGSVDFITFTSSSTVHNFLHGLSQVLGSKAQALDYLKKARLVTIGPSTHETLMGYGVVEARMAQNSTLQGLIETMIDDVYRSC